MTRNGASGRVVVVTGASAGVGRAVARAFAERGDAVGLLARGRDGLEAAAREVEAAGGRALVLPTDVADARAVEAAAARIEADLGPIDVWVNNAMATILARFEDVEPEEYRRATEVTYLGAVWGTRAALRRMRTRDRGVIVQVGSALAYRAIPYQAPYCGAKHAMRAMTDALRSELIHERSGVRLTMVHLPAMNTPQFSWCRTKLPRHPQPVPPIFQPEIAARAIVWAADHDRREIWVGRPTVQAILGNRVAPWLLDRHLARIGLDAQQTDEALPPGRPDNLFRPLPGDAGAHGAFDARARERSAQLPLSLHRAAVVGAAVAIAGGASLWIWLA